MTGSESEATLAGLIHEMRHPLLGIKAGLELLALRVGAAATGTEEWRMVTAQTARLEELFRTYQGLFTAAPEDIGISPLQACDRTALVRIRDQQGVDIFLR